MSDKIQLFILPYAGGNALSFTKLTGLLDPRIEAVTVEYPGHASRRNEGFMEDYEEFLGDAAAYIGERRRSDTDYAVLGYSMGSLIAYDLIARGLIGGKPRHAFLCAKGGVLESRAGTDYRYMSDSDFKKEVIALGGIDSRIFGNDRFLSAYIRPIRADYIILEQFEYRGGRIPCGATAIYSPLDPVSLGIEQWSEVTDGSVDYFEIGENHFFIFEHWQETADIINSHLI